MKSLFFAQNVVFLVCNKRVATLSLTIAIAAAPLLSAQQASAQISPQLPPPVWDSRSQDHPWSQNNREGRDGERNNSNERFLNGVVTRELNGEWFQMRTDDGRSVMVRLRNQQKQNRLSLGDRVRVNGYFEARRSIFAAETLNIVGNRANNRNRAEDWNRNDDWRRNGNRDRNRPGDWNRNDENWNGDETSFNFPVNFPGVVVTAETTRLVVRGENGRQYAVLGRNSFNRQIDVGDRVRVVGRSRNSTVLADRVELRQNRR